MKDVLEGARGLAKNPLGIIALFVAFVYGLAALVLGVSVQHLQGVERTLLVGFVVAFPVVVLVAFCVLVVWHHKKLYGPGDYRDDESFLRTLGPVERELRIETKISGAIDAESTKATDDTSPTGAAPSVGASEMVTSGVEVQRMSPSARLQSSSERSLSARVRDVASLGVLVVGRRLNLPIQPEVAVGAAHSIPFDGGYASQSEYLVVEIKYLPRAWVSLRQVTEIADRVLAAEGRIRRLGDTRRIALYLLLVIDEGTDQQIAAIRAKAAEVLSKAGFQHTFDVVTMRALRAEAVGNTD